jgi:hypothetical protein
MDKEAHDTMQGLHGKVLKYPELARLLDRAKAGEITEQETLIQMNQFALDHPEFVTDLMAPPEEPAPVPTPGMELQTVGDVLPPDGPLALFKPSSNGLPRLNPLIEGALIERVQYDGDIPELRTGPIPEGVAPAVAVKTKSRNPVAIGHMLNTASKRVGEQIKVHEAERKSLLAPDTEMLETLSGHAALVKLSDEELSVALQGSSDTDHPDYKRGQVPVPVRTRRPSGSALAAMTPQERREKAFQFFSTTQGRRSALPVIQELIATALRSEGLDVEEREFDPRAARETPLAFHEWSAVLGGAGSMQAAFSVIDVAATVLAKTLIKQMKGHGDAKSIILELTAINQLDIRTVGWAARVLLRPGNGIDANHRVGGPD